MKRNSILVGLALGTVVTLLGCSQSSPTAPKQPTPSTYAVSLTVSPNVAGINQSIVAVALVTVGGGNAPDGTPVTFNASGVAQFLTSTGALTQQVVSTTASGRAGVTVMATTGGSGLITATVPNKSASAQVNFTGGSVTQAAIFSVLPNRASPLGGTQVVIGGQGLLLPQAVKFIVSGNSYQAAISSVAADGSSITVLTPQLPNPSSSDVIADIQVTLGTGATVTFSKGFTFSASTGTPLLYSVAPATGSASGGDLIALTGKYFTEPIEVDFAFTDPNGGVPQNLAARIVDVQHGSDGTDTAHVQTPRASTGTVSQTIPVDLTIKNMVGGSSLSNTFPRAFSYVPDVTTPPTIFYISPAYGSVTGNDTVTIYGKNFVQPATVQIGSVNENVQSVSADGTTITIVTRPLTGTPPTDPQTVTVTTTLGVATLPAAFTYLEGQTPQLYVLTPNLGPLEGGTRVTITGTGFQYPVQVTFAVNGTNYQAQVVSNNFNQVVCVSPNITPGIPQGSASPYTASVSVTNTGTGKTSNTLPFTYGQQMFISGITPLQGPATGGTTVTITGQGFVSPVTVIFDPANLQLPWTVVSVAGTQVVAQSAALTSPRICSGASAVLRVTNLDSNLHADSTQSYSYQAVSPLISSVQIDGGSNTVTQYAPPTCTTAWSSHTITIKGSGFQGPTANVSIGPVGPLVGTVVDANTITLSALPDLTAVTINQIACTPGGGGCGVQNVATPVSVTVTNPTTGCTDTLANAIIINPCVTTCVPSSITALSLAYAGGTATVGTPFLVTANVSPAQTQPTSITLTCNPAFSCPSVTIPPTITSFPISITPVAAVSNGQIFATAGSGSCQITSNIVSVSAQAALSVTVVLNNSATGLVASSPTGISVNTATTQTYNFMTSPIVLTATPGTGSFGGWSGGTCPCSSTATTCNVTMDQARACTATFNNP